MGKSNAAVASPSETSTPAPKPPMPNMDVFLRGLIDPAAREQAEAELDAKIASKEEELAQITSAKREELAQLSAAKRALHAASVPEQSTTPRAPRQTRQSKNGAASKGRRPAGTGANHAPAIEAALKGSKGMDYADLSKAIGNSGHEISSKTLSTYLQIMHKRGDLVKEGERGSYTYRLKK